MEDKFYKLFIEHTEKLYKAQEEFNEYIKYLVEEYEGEIQKLDYKQKNR